jgi:ABC-type amino acid transport substrate-binding protein
MTGEIVLIRLLVVLGAAFGAAQAPTLRIASDATFPPFHFVGESGEPAGFEIELAHMVVERDGFQAHVVVVPYDELFSGLTSGAHDLVAATTGITPEREKLYLFTRPYFETCQAALVRAGDEEPEALADLAGRRVGAAGAGTSAGALAGLEGVEAVALGKGEAGVAFLEEGKIDALVLDEFAAVRAARASNGRLRVLQEPVALEQYAFVLSRENTELKDAFDRALDALEREGRLEELRGKFGLERDSDWPVDIGR